MDEARRYRVTLVVEVDATDPDEASTIAERMVAGTAELVRMDTPEEL